MAETFFLEGGNFSGEQISTMPPPGYGPGYCRDVRRPLSDSVPPIVIWRPGNCAPFAPLVTPMVVRHNSKLQPFYPHPENTSWLLP